ncbi:pseudouridine synthase [Hansschlegelia zhihuaiae]|uniref:Pseudouridine synthase n=1 Tax=Hansschlegelia zhihuaiae TaxID=405005 RepID=A0A4Q0MK31_9HYPH|nr:pseudouridine synthase [Hansschlegelia zhihuaiae]RXF74091.1 pseudouridine synthase [Hansschlegelia zhihuaiae]
MTEPEDPSGAPPATAAASEPPRSRPGERLAKAIARAGLGSRREAEVWIGEGRVAVNGETVATAAVNVLPGDRVEVDGRPLPARERTRLWLYHKPRGYVTTTHDPEGRETVFSILPPELPRVMTVGRLDINTEGLLLLTNDGGLARVLELPETGWLRRYRVRAFGRTTPEALAALKDGVTIDGFAYGAIDAEIERQQNDNVWLRFGLREGKNREVKRVAEHLGLGVNRLIRISFGPFQLGSLPEGGIEEVRTRTLVEQLGKRLTDEAGCDFEGPATDLGETAPRKTGGRGGGRPQAAPERSRLTDPSQRVGRRAPIARPRDMAPPPSAEGGEAPAVRTRRAAPVADRRGRSVKVEKVSHADPEAAPKRVRRRDDGAAERFGAAGRPARPPRAGDRPAARDARPPRRAGAGSARPPRRDGEAAERRGPPREGAGRGERPARAPYGDRPPKTASGDRPPRSDWPQRPTGDRPFGARPERPSSPKPRTSAPRWRDDAPASREGERPARPPRDGDRPQRARPEGGRPFGDRPPRPRRDGDRPRSDRPSGAGARSDRPGGDRLRADGPRTERPRGDRPDRAGARRAPRADAPRGDRPSGAPGGRPGGRPGGPGKPRSPGGKPRLPGGGGPKPRGPGGGGKGRPGGADRRR